MDQEERRRINRMLWEWGTALKDCERRRGEIMELMALAEDAECVLKAQVLNGMPRGSGVGDPTAAAVQMRERALVRVDALAEEINAIMERKEKLDAIIGLLPESRQTLLDLRYKRGLNLAVEIPMQMHASERTVTYWMADALEKIAEFCGSFDV